MKFAMLLVLALLRGQQPGENPLQKAAEAFDKVKSYSYRITVQKEKEVNTVEGMYVKEGGAFLVVTKKLSLFRRDGRWWILGEDKKWKALPEKKEEPSRPLLARREKEREKPSIEPHQLAKTLAALITSTRKERSSKIEGITCDVYVNNLPREKAKAAYEANGRGFAAGWADFVPTETGLMFHLGRRDGLFHRIEQVHSVGRTGRKDDDVRISLDFLEYNKAKLPKELLDLE